MQYITPAGETGRKVNENIELGKYQLELPSGPGEAPRFEWFKQSDLVPAYDPPAPVPQGPVEEMDLQAQLQQENAEQALEIIDLKTEIADLKGKLQICEQTIGSLNGQLDLATNEVIRLHEAGAAAPAAPAAPAPSENANNAG